ncbi:MAG: Tfp pilus assembly protein FimT [Candidatus Azotimanducaceae bacterium]|jgi:Tfp pilus assembly protein FimT
MELRAAMILETGPASNSTTRAGFTLLEIILVFALIALTASVMITNLTTFLNFDESVAPEETLRNAIRSARFQAASERRIATLSYDKETGSLVVSSGESFPLTADFGEGERGEIRFYLIPPAEGMESFPDGKRSQLETNEVYFAPDRSSSPFAAEIDTGQGTAIRLVFDPFSSLVRSAE